MIAVEPYIVQVVFQLANMHMPISVSLLESYLSIPSSQTLQHMTPNWNGSRYTMFTTGTLRWVHWELDTGKAS